MNILIVTEKPSVSRAIAPFARKNWPSGRIAFVHANPYGNFRFSYPRGLSLRDYPRLSEPENRLVSWENWRCVPFHLSDSGTLTEGVMTGELLTGADLIVSACDPDHTGAAAFDVLLSMVLGPGRAEKCPALVLTALDEESIERAFSLMSPFGLVSACGLAAGRIKRYFDWNWNMNSLAILGVVLRDVGVAPSAPPLSKYALQLLYAMRGTRSMTEGSLVHLMYKWPGTGRYKFGLGERRPRLGSAASAVPIIQNLLDADLIETRTSPEGSALLGISARGLALLGRLHPDCEDADLPFRLDAWCSAGEASKPAIDRYIRTFFGKQLRMMGQTAFFR